MVISSKDNSNIKLYKKLSTSKKSRNENGLYVLEGARLICDAINEKVVDKLFYVKSALDKYSSLITDEHIAMIPQNSLFEITDDLAKYLSSTEVSQGIFAIATKIENKFDENAVGSNSRFLILDNLQDPGNIGTILRTADACGVDTVLFTVDCCDLYNPKVIRSAMGSVFRLNLFTELEFDEIIRVLSDNNVTVYASVIDKTATEIRNIHFEEKSAVVIGNEGNGIPSEHIDLCDKSLTIRMCGNINSLNAGMAAGIILWEMTR